MTAGVVPQGAAWRREALLLAAHLAALALVCTLRFAVNFDVLLDGSDGGFATFSQYPGVLFTDPRSIVSISPYFGFGTNFAGPSPYFDPLGLIIQASGSAVAGYVVLAACIFLSVYALARSLGVGHATGAVAAWLLVIFLLPVWRAQSIMADIAGLIHPTSI